MTEYDDYVSGRVDARYHNYMANKPGDEAEQNPMPEHLQTQAEKDDARIASLESALERYRGKNAELLAALASERKSWDLAYAKTLELQAKLVAAEQRVRELAQALRGVIEEAAYWEDRIAQGMTADEVFRELGLTAPEPKP